LTDLCLHARCSALLCFDVPCVNFNVENQALILFGPRIHVGVNKLEPFNHNRGRTSMD